MQGVKISHWIQDETLCSSKTEKEKKTTYKYLMMEKIMRMDSQSAPFVFGKVRLIIAQTTL